jgi:tetratricopeptide (TPR) repeat protein
MRATSTIMPVEPRIAASAGDTVATIRSHCAAGRYGRALALANASRAAGAPNADLLFARGTVLLAWGRYREARSALTEAQSAGADDVELHLALAACHVQLGETAEAERHARRALTLDPAAARAHVALGQLLQWNGRFGDARSAFQRASELEPRDVESLLGISACFFAEGAPREAEDFARKAIVLAPGRPAPRMSLAMALGNQDRCDEALAALEAAAQAEAASGEDVESFAMHAYWLLWSGHPEQAVELCRRMLPHHRNPNAHGQYAFACLTLGLYGEGWRQYEFRWFQEPLRSRRIALGRPVWAGQDLAGRTLLLRAEQGVGDTIQFARFAASFKAMGARVILQAQPELQKLGAGFRGIEQVVPLADPPPAFDFYVRTMSAPAALGLELDCVPADVPYLAVDAALCRRWAERIDAGAMNVGLVWAGNPTHVRDRHRSLHFAELAGLWDIAGVRFVSLQKQLRPEDLAGLPDAKSLANVGVEFESFADTAALITSLDLVICVDTAVAHLAGALGKPVWLLLPAVGEFRWLQHREDSPWYPTMRLFRQRTPGDWREVMARVETELARVAAAGPVAGAVPMQARLPATSPRGTAQPVGGGPHHEATAAGGLAQVVEARHGIFQYVPDRTVEARALVWYGEHLQSHLDLVAQLLQPGAWVVEVGSGIGVHAVPLARMTGAPGHLIAYEDSADRRRLLRQNIEANRLDAVTTIMQRTAAGGAAISRQDAGGVETLAPSTTTHADGDPGDTIDDLHLERLDMLKVLHGDARKVIAGSAESLWRLRPLVLCAVPDDTSLEALFEQVRGFGYRCWVVTTPYFDVHNFNVRVDDVFAGDTGLALLGMPEEVESSIDWTGCTEMTSQAGSAKPAPVAGADSAHASQSDTPASARVGWLQRLTGRRPKE